MRFISLVNLFQHSVDPTHRRVWSKIDHDHQINRVVQGVDAVLQDPNFAFVMESTQAQKVLSERCDLMAVGNLGDRFTGLTFPKGSPYKDLVSKSIMKYHEDGSLQALRNKWLKPQRDCGDDELFVAGGYSAPASLVSHGPYLGKPHLQEPFFVFFLAHKKWPTK